MQKKFLRTFQLLALLSLTSVQVEANSKDMTVYSAEVPASVADGVLQARHLRTAQALIANWAENRRVEQFFNPRFIVRRADGKFVAVTNDSAWAVTSRGALSGTTQLWVRDEKTGKTVQIIPSDALKKDYRQKMMNPPVVRHPRLW